MENEQIPKFFCAKIPYNFFLHVDLSEFSAIIKAIQKDCFFGKAAGSPPEKRGTVLSPYIHYSTYILCNQGKNLRKERKIWDAGLI